MSPFRIPFASSFAFFVLSSSLSATTIITPSGAFSATGNLSNRPIENTINSDGLSGVGDILTQTHNVNSGNSGQYWIGNVAGAELTYTLPGASAVDSIHLWSYSRTGEEDRAMQSFDISFSSDGVNFGSPINLSGWTRPSFPYNGSPIEVQSQSFASQTGVTHIRLNNIVNFGDGSFVGLSEVRFSAVPEPAAMLLGSLGLLSILRRHRPA